MAFRIKILGTVARPTIEVTGENRESIQTWNQLEPFGIHKDRLMEHIDRTWKRRPRAILLSEQSVNHHWSDQSFARYGWTPAALIKRAVRSAIIKETNEPYAVIVDEFYHEGPAEVGQYGTTVDKTLSNSIETNWTGSVSVGSSTEVSVEVGGDAVGAKVGVKQTLSLDTSFGKGGSKVVDDSTRVERRLDTELRIGERALAKLTATKGSLVASVVYHTLIEGGLWLDFGKRHRPPGKDHAAHFWYLPLRDHVGSPLKAIQLIDIDFYHRATAGWSPA